MRLTKEWKDNTVRVVLENKLKDKEKAIADRYEKFAIDYINKANKPYVKELKIIPDNYLNIGNYIRFSFGEGFGETIGIDLSEKMILPMRSESYGNISKTKLTGKDKKDFIDIYNDSKIVSDYRLELRQELTKVIYSCTTDRYY